MFTDANPDTCTGKGPENSALSEPFTLSGVK